MPVADEHGAPNPDYPTRDEWDCMTEDEQNRWFDLFDKWDKEADTKKPQGTRPRG